MSSMIRYSPRFSQNSTISEMNRSEYIAPDGLFGLLMMTALVYEVTTCSISCRK